MKKFILGLLSLLLLTGCSFTSNKGEVKVYTTYHPIQYFTDYLYGDYSSIESIYPSEADINNYELTDKQKSIYSKGDVFIYTGVKREIDLAVDLLNQNENIRILDASKGLNYKNDVSELWLDPSNALMIARNIKSNLEDYDENVYNRNKIEDKYEELKIKISELDVELTLMGKNASRNAILVNDDTLLFLSKYNVKVLSVDNDNPDYSKNLNEAKNLINSGDIKYIFKTTGSTYNEEITNIINSYGLEELEINTMYTLSEDERKNSDTYLTIMDSNITKFKTELFR